MSESDLVKLFCYKNTNIANMDFFLFIFIYKILWHAVQVIYDISIIRS